MVREVSQLGLEIIPVFFYVNQLVHCGIAVFINTVIVRVDEVAFNVGEGFNFDLGHVYSGRAGTHRRVRVVVNVSANGVYCYHTEIFNQHYD